MQLPRRMTCSREKEASFDDLCRPFSCPAHTRTLTVVFPSRDKGVCLSTENGLRFIEPRSYGKGGRDCLLVLSLVTSTPSDKVFTDNSCASRAIHWPPRFCRWGTSLSRSLSRVLSLSLSRGSSDEFRSRLHFDFIFNKLFTPRACRGVIHDAHSLARLHRHACVLVVYF